jgi:NO-binding membrane sensor protein with MHYT domain
MIEFAIAFALSIGCFYLYGRIAERRGRSVKLWLWLGAFFGPIALVLVRLLPPRQEDIVS